MTIVERAIDHYTYGVTHDIFSEPVTSYAKLSIEALEKQIPKKPIHIHEEHSEHLWQRDKNGEIDIWAFEAGYCNGPVCARCWHSECVHCNEDWETDPVCNCVVDKDICPVCGSVLTWKHKYCHECGQALDWSESV
jgi:hypothetical protein